MIARKWRLGLLVVLLTGAVVGGPYLWAWHHLRAGEDALQRYHAEEALEHLSRYVWVCPGSVRGHLLASRAARRAGDAETAEMHLRTCRRLHPDKSEEIALEWALLRVTQGDLDENETYVLMRARKVPPTPSWSGRRSSRATLGCTAFSTRCAS